MKVQYIESLLALYDTQNMSQACEQLYITQQGLSRQIIALEKELGVTLFTRTKNGMIPSEICVSLYPEFKQMADSYHRVQKLCARQIKTEEMEEIHIIAATGLLRLLDYGQLTSVVKSFGIPSITMEEYSTDECMEKLLSKEADIAFLLDPVDDSLLEHIHIFQAEGSIAISKNHPFASIPGPLPLSMFDGQSIVSGIRAYPIIVQLEQYFAREGIHPHYVASISDLAGFINALHADDLAVLLLKNTISKISNPDIVFKEVVNPRFIIQIDGCYKRDSAHSKLFKDIVSKIKKIYQNEESG